MLRACFADEDAQFEALKVLQNNSDLFSIEVSPQEKEEERNNARNSSDEGEEDSNLFVGKEKA